ncbi:MAG TPA: cupin domain-containing protein [Candidatus Ozemobacteraceae bacterium]|nr:cupin domain-containing protein [Candidatus Ozemobacteraceae bacterium]
MKYTLDQAQTVLETPTARGRKLATEFDLEAVHLELSPGGAIPDHALDVPVAFYVVSGRGRLAVDGIESEAECGSWLTVPPKARRRWNNHGSELLTLLVVKQLRS